jgi:hypothetical protein
VSSGGKYDKWKRKRGECKRIRKKEEEKEERGK